MEELHFISCLADPDVWLRPAQKHNGTKYYEYVLIYTNDFLCISTYPKKILDSIGMHFKLKPKSIKMPEVSLGANLECFMLPDNPSKQQWSMSSTNYVKQAVANVEKDLDEIGKHLSTKIASPMSSNY